MLRLFNAVLRLFNAVIIIMLRSFNVATNIYSFNAVIIIIAMLV